ncbi:MAG: hypothetical protein RLY93_13295 [Sumerlaeia bacterium]
MAPAGFAPFHGRPRYRPEGSSGRGFAKGMMLIIGAMILAGLAARWFTGVAAENSSSPMIAVWRVMAPLLGPILGYVLLLRMQPKMIVCRVWLLLLVSTLLCVSYGVAYETFGKGALIPRLASEGLTVATGLGLAWWLLRTGLLVAVGFLVVGSDAFRVTYGRGPDLRWARVREAYFHPYGLQPVMAALQAADAPTIARFRMPPPVSRADGNNAYVVIQISTDPRDEAGSPAYLFLKDVSAGGGPAMARSVHLSPGSAKIKHARLHPGERERLLALLPDMIDATELARKAEIRRDDRTPLGLLPGTPPRVENPQTGSLIELLPPGERRNFVLRGNAGIITFLACFVVGFLLLFVAEPLAQKIAPENKLVEAGLGAVAGLGMLGGMLFWLVQSLLAGKLAARQLRRRPGRLFEPDEGCLHLKIEESHTYNRMKAFEDDQGMLCLRPGWFLLETGSTRIRLAAADVRMEVQHTAQTASLRIFSTVGGHEWGIVARETRGRFGGFLSSHKGRAEGLWRHIYEELTRPH